MAIPNDENLIQEMMKAGLHFGHKKTFNHPKASYFIVKSYEEIAGINLEETVKALNQALEFLKDAVNKGGQILLVGTTPGAREPVKKLAQKYHFPYVNERWLGGTLTNFKTLALRIKTLKDLEEQKATGEWEKYTKKERAKLEKELEQLQRKFAGLRIMEKLPAALLVVDTGAHLAAVREAKILGIPVVGILDTDDDPTLIDYPIPANDSAKSAIEYLLSKIEIALQEGITSGVTSTDDQQEIKNN